jgi:SAM-dependent methyltransferase
VTDDTNYADTEYLYNRVMEPALANAINALGLRTGQSVLDAGCGPGGVLPLLYEGVAPTGTVVGLDISSPHVARARDLVRMWGLQDAITVEVADLTAELPVEPASCDVVWSADVLYPDTVGDSGAVVSRLSRLLKPGGSLAIFYGNWLRAMYLPGFARLEHLICAAREMSYARERPWEGHAHPERALDWLRDASLTACQLKAFPLVYRQPLPTDVRQYVTSAILNGHYARAVMESGRDVGMTVDDDTLWRRISDPEHADYVFDQPEYYCVLSPLLVFGYRV